jgi:carbon monoxide dehydrogenase subunit G
MSKLQARNEAIINAPISSIWALITDINQFHKINPGLIKATGTMNVLNGTRVCDINNQGKTGTITERLIEFAPEKKTVWTIENDNMGWSKMLKDTRFCFELEKLDDSRTRIVNETYYTPANLMAGVMNVFMMRGMIRKAQNKILENIKSLTEK